MKITEFKALQFVKNSGQLPVGAQWFVGSPPHPGCIMIYSYHQMCPTLNSKPYCSNKQVVPLLGCCSDALGSPGNRLVICGFKPSFNPILMLKNDLVHISTINFDPRVSFQHLIMTPKL